MVIQTLLVDDVEEIRVLLQTALESQQFEKSIQFKALTASHVMEARVAFERFRPPVILLDALLPVGESAQDWERELLASPDFRTEHLLFLMTGGPSSTRSLGGTCSAKDGHDREVSLPVFIKPDRARDLERDIERVWIPTVVKAVKAHRKIGS